MFARVADPESFNPACKNALARPVGERWCHLGLCSRIRAHLRSLRGRIEELVENIPDLVALIEPMLVVRRVLREQINILHRRLSPLLNVTLER